MRVINTTRSIGEQSEPGRHSGTLLKKGEIEMKRASDYAKQKSQLGDYKIVSLHGSDLFGKDFVVQAFETLEGQYGAFVNILVEPLVNGKAMKDDAFIVSSGSAAIMKTLENIDAAGGFPVIGKFGTKMGKNHREYYVLE